MTDLQQLCSTRIHSCPTYADSLLYDRDFFPGEVRFWGTPGEYKVLHAILEESQDTVIVEMALFTDIQLAETDQTGILEIVPRDGFQPLSARVSSDGPLEIFVTNGRYYSPRGLPDFIEVVINMLKLSREMFDADKPRLKAILDSK